jgi:hypothetical protein
MADGGSGLGADLGLDDIALVDHHCHSVVRGPVDPARFESLATEGNLPPSGASAFDSMLGLAIRRVCAPLLDLAPLAGADEYLRRRAELGADDVTRRLLRSTRTDAYLVDTGFRADELLSLAELAVAADAGVREVVRVEAVAERVAASGCSAAGYGSAVTDAIATAATEAVGLKSIAAYRVGLDLPARPPDAGAVARAADRWLATGGARLDDPVLVAHAVHAGLATGLPLQFHTGFGDADEDLHRANPVLLAPLCRAVTSPVLLLHCWPYHREAAWLAHVLPNVYLDVGLAIPYVGARAADVLAETLEVAPFGKVLYSSDAFGLPELYATAAALFKRACVRVIGGLVDAGDATPDDARRIVAMLCHGNARRVYGL